MNSLLVNDDNTLNHLALVAHVHNAKTRLKQVQDDIRELRNALVGTEVYRSQGKYADRKCVVQSIIVSHDLHGLQIYVSAPPLKLVQAKGGEWVCSAQILNDSEARTYMPIDNIYFRKDQQ